jgi:hypothetical protein
MTDTHNEIFELSFKLGLFFFIILVLYLFLDKNMDNGLKIILVVMLYFILLADRCYDSGVDYRDSHEGFGRSGDRIAALNKNRGQLGQFYVQCNKCGRDRIVEEKRKSKKQHMVQNKGYCMNGCKDTVGNTMSFYNKKYIDTDQIFCYNCLLDKDSHQYVRNYRNFPYVNGPPGTNEFTH